MSDLYETDILAWSERQAALLRRVAAGERVNDADLDWPDIIEEIESVGRSELNAVESLLVQAMRHMLKVQAWPNSVSVDHWIGETGGFRADAAALFKPGWRQRIDLQTLYDRARKGMPPRMDGQPPLPVPTVCPWTLDELLGGEP
jgi:hypothetical protein